MRGTSAVDGRISSRKSVPSPSNTTRLNDGERCDATPCPQRNSGGSNEPPERGLLASTLAARPQAAKTVSDGVRRGRGTVLIVCHELTENPGDHRRHCPVGNPKVVRNFTISQPLCHETEDFPLSRREALDVGRQCSAFWGGCDPRL